MSVSDILSMVSTFTGIIAAYYIGLNNGRIEVLKEWDEWMLKILSERDDEGGAE